jgi:hypothetical protein
VQPSVNSLGLLLSRFLDRFQKGHGKDHGAKAQAGDIERAKAVEALEERSEEAWNAHK